MAGDIQGIADWCVLDTLTEGERATIYRAQRAAGGEGMPPTALKLLRRETLYDEAETAAFRERYKAALRLSDQAPDPRIVRVIEVGEADGRPWAAMELVDGLPLLQLGPRSARGRLPTPAAVTVLLDVLAALDAASKAVPPLAHGRLGPEHLILDSDGQARVVGFGAPGGPQADLLAVARLAQRLAKAWPSLVDAWIDRLQHGDEAFSSPADALAAFPLDAFEEGVEAKGRKAIARAVKRGLKAAEEPDDDSGASPSQQADDDVDIVIRERPSADAAAADGEPFATPDAAGADDPDLDRTVRQARTVAWLCAAVVLLALASELF